MVKLCGPETACEEVIHCPSLTMLEFKVCSKMSPTQGGGYRMVPLDQPSSVFVELKCWKWHVGMAT